MADTDASILEDSLRLLANTKAAASTTASPVVVKKDDGIGSGCSGSGCSGCIGSGSGRPTLLERAMASPEIALEPSRYAKVFEALRLLEEYAAEVRALLPVKPKSD